MEVKKQTICAIVAVGPDNVIGLDGGMPWHSKQDFYHFKKMTIGNPCIFGKTTYFNLPKRPLSKRPNIICSSSYHDEVIDDCYCASSLESALKYCYGFPHVFICGGGALYKYAFNQDLIDIAYLTKIDSAELAKQIAMAPDKYARFPFDITTFFNTPKWSVENMVYPSDVLPVENPGVLARFFKYTRNR